MIISQSARECAVRIAMKNIALNPSELLIVAIAKDVQVELDKVVPKIESSYFILRDVEDFDHQFWTGAKWGGAGDKKVCYTFDEAVKAYRAAHLSCPDKVLITHATATGVVKYQPL